MPLCIRQSGAVKLVQLELCTGVASDVVALRGAGQEEEQAAPVKCSTCVAGHLS